MVDSIKPTVVYGVAPLQSKTRSDAKSSTPARNKVSNKLGKLTQDLIEDPIPAYDTALLQKLRKANRDSVYTVDYNDLSDNLALDYTPLHAE